MCFFRIKCKVQNFLFFVDSGFPFTTSFNWIWKIISKWVEGRWIHVSIEHSLACMYVIVRARRAILPIKSSFYWFIVIVGIFTILAPNMNINLFFLSECHRSRLLAYSYMDSKLLSVNIGPLWHFIFRAQFPRQLNWKPRTIWKSVPFVVDAIAIAGAGASAYDHYCDERKSTNYWLDVCDRSSEVCISFLSFFHTR